MEERYSSPHSRAPSPRPETYRKRSNSFPLVDALGCSTPEAELILAEGRAAIRSRHAHSQGRRNRSANDETLPFRPRDHIKYLEQRPELDRSVTKRSIQSQPQDIHHARIPSNTTDKSGSTIVGLTSPLPKTITAGTSPTTPLGDYSANLARFIQSQLDSIASYQPSTVSPRSCPDLGLHARTPPLSPQGIARRQVFAPNSIEIPSVRPPLRSAFSAWSETDDEDDQETDMAQSVPSNGGSSTDVKGRHYTPSILQYYEGSNNASFLLSSTPLEEAEQDHPNAEGFIFPARPTLTAHATEPHSTQYESDYPSSALSSRPQLTASSAPSFASSSTASYFDCKRPIAFAPDVRDRIIAAVSPHVPSKNMLQATSPFEGGALANVHDVLIDSQHRVLVDGLTFDMVQNMQVSGTVPRVTTPC